MQKILAALFMAVLFNTAAFASKEGTLHLSEIIYKSNGIGKSGPVVVTINKNGNNEITSLSIEAFNKKFTLPKEQLKEIPKLPYNGLLLSYVRGYKKNSRGNILISLYFGFTSGIVQKTLIYVNDSGKISIVADKENSK